MLRAVFFLLGLLAGTTAPTPAPTPPATPHLREIAPGIFEYNGVRLDKKNHRISFPAIVNQREGFIEYLLVHEKGKVHESLFSTAVPPLDLHLAMLLVGLKEDEHANSNAPVPPSAIDSAYLQSAPKLKGTYVQISVAWMQDGRRREVSPDQWILNLQTNRPMTPGPWTYNGSLVQDGVFLATQELSIIAVITDPTALVNNPRAGYDNDEIWQVQDKVVPPLNTPVEISITLADSPQTQP
jgi:hypothetical protein